MNTKNGTSAPHFAEAIKMARAEEELGVRELSRRAGISHTQISRLESGKVRTPTREALVAIARGLDRSPIPLLILAGHIGHDESASALRRMKVEVPEGEDELQRAFDAFVSPHFLNRWDDAYLLESAQGRGAQPLKELVDIWRELTPPLQRSLLFCGKEHLALMERVNVALENEENEIEEENEDRLEELREALRETDQRLQDKDPDQLIEYARALVELTDRAEEVGL